MVDFRFEEVQTLKFTVYDVDDKHHIDDTTRHDFIGAMECSLADIVAAGQQYKRTLRVSGELLRTFRCNYKQIHRDSSLVPRPLPIFHVSR